MVALHGTMHYFTSSNADVHNILPYPQDNSQCNAMFIYAGGQKPHFHSKGLQYVAGCEENHRYTSYPEPQRLMSFVHGAYLQQTLPPCILPSITYNLPCHVASRLRVHHLEVVVCDAYAFNFSHLCNRLVLMHVAAATN